jgi:hypothetical protein
LGAKRSVHLFCFCFLKEIEIMHQMYPLSKVMPRFGSGQKIMYLCCASSIYICKRFWFSRPVKEELVPMHFPFRRLKNKFILFFNVRWSESE